MTGAAPGQESLQARYEVLCRVIGALNSDIPDEKIVQAVAEAMRAVVPWDRFTLGLPWLRRRYVVMEGKVESQEGYRVVPADEETASGGRWVIQNRKALLREDIAESRTFRYDAALLEEGMRADLIVPLIEGNEVTGTLHFTCRRARSLNETHLHTVQHLADVLAPAFRQFHVREELRASEERYRTLVEHAPEAIAILNADTGRFVEVNANAQKLFGLTREELLKVDPLELSPSVQPDGRPSRDTAADWIGRALRGESLGFEWLHRGPGGREFWCEKRVVRHPAPGRNLLRCSITDISERKRLEREMVRLERLNALNQVAGGFAHNFNNLLVGVLGYAQLARMRVSDNEVASDIDRIIQSATRAQQLVARLNLSVHGSYEGVEALDVNEVVSEAVQATRPRWKDEAEAHGLRIEVVTRLAPVHAVRATHAGLYGGTVNMILNSVEALPRGGTITVTTDEENGFVRLRVADDGIGMDAATMRRVFEPFFTTKAGVGTGLALSTLYGNVQGWGGTVEAASEPGRGTEFVLRIPVWAASAQPAAAGNAREDRPPGVRARILLVEDDESVRNVLSRHLANRHDLVVVGSGEEALRIFRPGRFDAVMTDLGMPGLPGDEVARRLRERDRALVTVLITGWELPEGDPRLAGFDFHLCKPFADLAAVEETLALAPERYRARSGSRDP